VPPLTESQSLNGLLVVDKPLRLTSAAVVARVKRAAGGAKVGHAGALDPMATGVLICCIGRATRWVPKLMELSKAYEATVDLSAFTASDDRESPPEVVAVSQAPDEQQIRGALGRFIGDVLQRPPLYSAVHVGGRRAYKLARQGKDVQLPARRVHIEAIDLLGYRWPLAKLRVKCGKGTYIRSLARDLGLALGTGGHLASLRRTAVGPYDLSRAVFVEELDRPLEPTDLLAPPA